MQTTPSKAQLEQYIRQAARERGIDPDIAVKVARSEGLSASAADGWQSNYKKDGIREPSYGPFQLLVGGKGTGFPTGLGNLFKSATGLDPKDPKTVYQQIDFALDRAAQSGWGAWYGAAKVGVDKWDGLRNATPRGISDGPTNLANAEIPIPTARPGDTAPVPQVDRGLLAALFSQPAAQASERVPAEQPYAGDAVLSNNLPFEPLREANTGDPFTALMPTMGGQFAGSTDPAYQFEFTPGFSPVEPVTPAGGGPQPLRTGASTQATELADPGGGTLVSERNFLPLYAPEVRPFSPPAVSGLFSTPKAAAEPMPAQPTPMGLSDYASMASMPNYPGMNDPAMMGVDRMTTAGQQAMYGKPALDPSQPLDYPGIPVPAPRPAAPLPPPRQVAPPPQVASATVPMPQPPQINMPGAVDVWQGRSPYGMASDGSTLSRNPGGSVSRYSQQYDNWSTYNPETQTWQPGGAASGGINLPSKERVVDAGKKVGAGAAGSLLGSAIAGPAGGIIGAILAREAASGGNGILGNLFGGNTTFPAAPQSASYPSAPAPLSASEAAAPAGFVSTLNTENLSPGVLEAIATGRGGLF